MVAERDYIIRKFVRVADGRFKPSHDGDRESVFWAALALRGGRRRQRVRSPTRMLLVPHHCDTVNALIVRLGAASNI
jgi:hypothetical protein